MKTDKFILLLCVTIILIMLSVASSTQAAVTYDYDALGRLTSINYGGDQSITYTYDDAGNILQRIVGCLKGELNNDGVVNVLDAIAALRIVLALDVTPGNICPMDLDNSGVVDITDVIGILISSL